MKLPSEFSFKLSNNDRNLFYATKHGVLDIYTIAWNSDFLNRICIEHYLVEDVKELILKSSWIIVESF